MSARDAEVMANAMLLDSPLPNLEKANEKIPEDGGSSRLPGEGEGEKLPEGGDDKQPAEIPADSQNTGNTVGRIEEVSKKAVVVASTSQVTSGCDLSREKVEHAFKLLEEVLGRKGVQTPDETELNALKERVKTLSSEKTALEGKLKKVSQSKKGDGEVFTWGRGTHGQLGHGNLDSIPHPKFVKFLENHKVTCVSAGWNHSGFATDSGKLFMCGDGSFGQLGTGDNHSRNFPFEVAYFTAKHIEKLALGMRHSLVLLKDNSVYGFGSARRGQVGKCASRNGKSYNVPRLIDGFSDFKIVNIYANGDHSAALDEYGHLYIWGRALIGQHDNDHPCVVLPSLSISQVALGWHHALVLSAGELFTIGVYRHQKCDLPVPRNVVGQQSNTSGANSSHDSSSSLSATKKIPCIDGERVVQIASGTEHSAFVTDKGTVFTWGWGEHGQLGLGDTSDQVVPQRVNIAVSSGPRGVYCGSGFTIAVDLD